jgi:hypothetical protein
MKEIWKVVPGYVGFYSVSNKGRVRTEFHYRKGRSGKPVPVNQRILAPCKSGAGYLAVNLSKHGIIKREYVHRIVLLAFVGECPEGMECRHHDGDKHNNKVDNLCWGTHAQNGNDSVELRETSIGERNGFAKMTWKSVREARQLHKRGWTQRKIAERFRVSYQTISLIVRHLTWKE